MDSKYRLDVNQSFINLRKFLVYFLFKLVQAIIDFIDLLVYLFEFVQNFLLGRLRCCLGEKRLADKYQEDANNNELD